MKIHSTGRTEFIRFDKAIRKLLSVSSGELHRKIEIEKKKRKAAKPSAASRASGGGYLADGLFFAVLAEVEAEALLIEITKQMKRFNRNICPSNPTLEKRPEVLHAIRMHIAVCVLDRVINNRVLVVGRQSVIGLQFIAEDAGASPDVLLDLGVKSLASPAIHDHGAGASAALQKPEDNSLILAACSGDLLCALVLVHVSRLAADKRLVNLDFAAQCAAVVFILHCEADTLEHEPCGLLCDTQSAVDFVAGNPVLAVSEHPDGAHPLGQRNRRTLKDGPDLDAELLLGVLRLALPQVARSDIANVVGAAGRANGLTVRPPARAQIFNRVVFIGEVDYGFLECLRLLVLHNKDKFTDRWFTESSISLLKIGPSAAPISPDTRGIQPDKPPVIVYSAIPLAVAPANPLAHAVAFHAITLQHGTL